MVGLGILESVRNRLTGSGDGDSEWSVYSKTKYTYQGTEYYVLKIANVYKIRFVLDTKRFWIYGALGSSDKDKIEFGNIDGMIVVSPSSKTFSNIYASHTSSYNEVLLESSSALTVYIQYNSTYDTPGHIAWVT